MVTRVAVNFKTRMKRKKKKKKRQKKRRMEKRERERDKKRMKSTPSEIPQLNQFLFCRGDRSSLDLSLSSCLLFFLLHLGFSPVRSL